MRLFFAISGREGPETPVNGGSGRKSRAQYCDSCLLVHMVPLFF